MKQIVKQLMVQIQAEVDSIANYINGKTQAFQSDVFEYSGSFQIAITKDEFMEKARCLRGKKGIYIFKTIDSFEFTNERIHNWNQCSGARVNSQDPNGNMYPFHVDAGRIFYIGSCYSKSLQSRIITHCNQATDVQEASLKLGHSNRGWVKPYLQVYYFSMASSFSDSERHLLIPEFEKQLHNRFRAIIGSNRT